jgi:hypothetical protein
VLSVEQLAHARGAPAVNGQLGGSCKIAAPHETPALGFGDHGLQLERVQLDSDVKDRTRDGGDWNSAAASDLRAIDRDTVRPNARPLAPRSAAHLNRPARPREKPPHVSGRAAAQHCVRPAGQYGCHLGGELEWCGVTHAVHPAVNGVEESALDSNLNLGRAEADRQQLDPGGESTLQLGQPSERTLTGQALPQNPPQNLVPPKRVSF